MQLPVPVREESPGPVLDPIQALALSAPVPDEEAQEQARQEQLAATLRCMGFDEDVDCMNLHEFKRKVCENDSLLSYFNHMSLTKGLHSKKISWQDVQVQREREAYFNQAALASGRKLPQVDVKVDDLLRET